MAGVEGEPRRGEPTPQQRRPTEHHKPQMEAGNGAPGIPPTLHERAKPPPERQEANPLTPRSQEQQPPDKMSDLVLNSALREWSWREKSNKRSGIFKEITKGKIFPNTPEGAEQFRRAAEAVWPIPEPSELKGPTTEELDRMAEEEMARLKTMRTISERIDHVMLEVPGLFDRLLHLDPEFMSPISIGLEKRESRLEKKLRAIERISQGRAKDHPPGSSNH